MAEFFKGIFEAIKNFFAVIFEGFSFNFDFTCGEDVRTSTDAER